jgi:tetratricopeptide (TPR) repeat protein
VEEAVIAAFGLRLSAFAMAAQLAAAEPTLLERAKEKVERLWKKPEPQVDSANTKVRRGDPKGALELYDKAGETLKEPHHQGALAFDRGTAFIAEGRQSASLAAEEARRALESTSTELHPRAAYNLGFALAEGGKREEAIEAYAKALRLDPTDEDARYNLELLLREKKQQQGGAGQQQENKPQSGNDQQQQEQQQSKDDEQKQDKSENKQQAQQKQQPQQQQQEQKDEQQQAQRAKLQKDRKEQPAPARPVDRTEAQRLLDALRANEKNLQVWRFGQRRTPPQRQRDVAKDW